MERDHEARRLHRTAQVPKQDIPRAASGLIRIGLRLTGLHWRGQRNARHIAVRRHVVTLPHLPAEFDGFTLLQLSDLHIDAAPGFTAALVEAVRPLTYDICVLTGDYRARTFGPYDAALTELAALRPHLKDPLYAVLGNHDTIRLVPPMEALGYRFLLNENVAIECGGAAIFLFALGGVPAPGLIHVLLFLALLALSVLTLFAFALLMAGSLFVWVGNGRVQEVMESVMVFAQYPSSLYGRTFQLVLAVILPASMIAFLPAQALLGRPAPITLASAPACIAFFFASLAFWRAMVRRYAGGGG